MNPASSATALPQRLASIDAYRGLVMLLMLGEVLALGQVASQHPDSGFWKFLAHHQSHVEWVGCTLHDLIQPSFSFLVGVALPFSLASRVAKGQTFGQMLRHAIGRSLILIFLGIFLRSIGKPHTNYTFEDTLTQIGLGYTFLFLIGRKTEKIQWLWFAVLMVGYWLAFALYPLPGPDFDWKQAGVPVDWPHHLSGFAAHWNKNSNFAWAFDTWFMNLFPRERPFLNNGGGYSTLSFIPTLGTMLLGSIAGLWLQRETTAKEKMIRLLIAGISGLFLGSLLHLSGICPIVKRIWTPAWTLFSGGFAFLFLAGFYAIIDFKRWKKWSFFLVVVGMNSIAAYVMEWLFIGFFRSAIRTHLGDGYLNLFGPSFSSLIQGMTILLLLWLILFWMYRRKLFLKI
ncbi:MAG: DUF5009 domain-containing protein [Verrucomicrobiota bacterium]|nr:DUF5009 domain-containing protein [Verrucomicrobiota bacterium]